MQQLLSWHSGELARVSDWVGCIMRSVLCLPHQHVFVILESQLDHRERKERARMHRIKLPTTRCGVKRGQLSEHPTLQYRWHARELVGTLVISGTMTPNGLRAFLEQMRKRGFAPGAGHDLLFFIHKPIAN